MDVHRMTSIRSCVALASALTYGQLEPSPRRERSTSYSSKQDDFIGLDTRMTQSSRGNQQVKVFVVIFCMVLGTLTCGQLPASPRFRYSSGFFIQGIPSQPVPATTPPHMGLVEGKTWQDVQAAINTKRSGVQMKLVIFLRHGEGTHNVAIEKYGSDAWSAYYCKLPEYLDAPLTAKGAKQAEESSTRLNTEIDNGLQLEHVLISPMERALRTFSIVYQNQTSKITGMPLELPREVLGVDTCDERRSISEKKLQYLALDFSGFDSDVDPWWTPNHRETNTEIETRATKFLEMMFYNVSAQSVGVVSHSVFGAALLRVIGHREYSLGTAEFLPLLIEEITTA